MIETKVWLILIVTLFSIGLYGILTRRHALGVLISVELMLNACGVAFVFFERMRGSLQPDGQGMALFVIAVAAAEVVVAMALFILVVGSRKTTDITQLNLLAIKDSEASHE